jgi:hypothetical protein
VWQNVGLKDRECCKKGESEVTRYGSDCKLGKGKYVWNQTRDPERVWKDENVSKVGRRSLNGENLENSFWGEEMYRRDLGQSRART